MIKIISKKEYEDLWEIIEMQDKQIETLINMVIEANTKITHMTECYCELVELIDKNISLPKEAIDLVDEIRKSMERA